VQRGDTDIKKAKQTPCGVGEGKKRGETFGYGEGMDGNLMSNRGGFAVVRLQSRIVDGCYQGWEKRKGTTPTGAGREGGIGALEKGKGDLPDTSYKKNRSILAAFHSKRGRGGRGNHFPAGEGEGESKGGKRAC